jgi:hypothetical protein
MYTYNSLDCHFNEGKLMNAARKIRGLLSLKGHITQAKEDHLD